MELTSLALLAIDVVALGAAATVLLTRWIPQPVAELAAQHGRFIHLDAAGAGTQAALHRQDAYLETMNARTTSN